MNLVARFSALLILQQSFEVEAVMPFYRGDSWGLDSSHNFPEVTQLVKKKTSITDTIKHSLLPASQLSSTVDNIQWFRTTHKLHGQGQELSFSSKIMQNIMQGSFPFSSVCIQSGLCIQWWSLVRRKGWCTGRSNLNFNPSYTFIALAVKNF